MHSPVLRQTRLAPRIGYEGSSYNICIVLGRVYMVRAYQSIWERMSESLGVRRRGMSVVMMNLIGYVEAVWLWIDPHYDSHLYPKGA
ncbi:hypothetical protein BD310DRAFT_938527 [Dichomitus squalens]|uniref:Uncharacterized protein n=1 Tax=Dichomitus squalens TaxID=114155 RepID=A0A4Q9PET1_9APHY|nr:hypothetical protein BD310DRAFT_938527 [Dichomitus squalens]